MLRSRKLKARELGGERSQVTYHRKTSNPRLQGKTAPKLGSASGNQAGQDESKPEGKKCVFLENRSPSEEQKNAPSKEARLASG
jgi:hypothetical protein